MCKHGRVNMVRKMGLRGSQLRDYREAKRLGMTDATYATEVLGVSPSTLSRWKTSGRGPATRTLDRIEEFQERIQTTEWQGEVAVTETRITYEELERLATRGSSPRTRRIAQDKLDEIGEDYSDYDIQELENMTFDRPTYYRTFQGQRVELLLGRTKSEMMQEAARKQFIAKGLGHLLSDDYNDFGGYGGA